MRCIPLCTDNNCFESNVLARGGVALAMTAEAEHA
jgi:hypothetical protein